MTNSRETDRRRAFKQRQHLDPPTGTVLNLTTLCLIPGCLTPRRGANLCQAHQNQTDQLEPCHGQTVNTPRPN